MPEIDIIVARILKLVLSLFAISTSSQNLPANQKVTMLENPRKAKEKIDDNSRLFPQSKLEDSTQWHMWLCAQCTTTHMTKPDTHWKKSSNIAKKPISADQILSFTNPEFWIYEYFYNKILCNICYDFFFNYSNVPNRPVCRLIWYILFFKREEVILPFSFEITKCTK